MILNIFMVYCSGNKSVFWIFDYFGIHMAQRLRRNRCASIFVHNLWQTILAKNVFYFCDSLSWIDQLMTIILPTIIQVPALAGTCMISYRSYDQMILNIFMVDCSGNKFVFWIFCLIYLTDYVGIYVELRWVAMCQ